MDPTILEELYNIEVSTIKVEELKESIGLIDRIITANRIVESLGALWTQARIGDTKLKLEDGLLLY